MCLNGVAERLLPVTLRNSAQGYLTYPDVNLSSVSRAVVNAFKGTYLFTYLLTYILTYILT